jgi:hypothetical protein
MPLYRTREYYTASLFKLNMRMLLSAGPGLTETFIKSMLGNVARYGQPSVRTSLSRVSQG